MLELFLLIPNFSLLDGHSISIRCFTHHPCSYPHSHSHSHLNSRFLFLVSSGDLFCHPLVSLFTLTLTSPPPTTTSLSTHQSDCTPSSSPPGFSLSHSTLYHTPHLFDLLRHPLPLPINHYPSTCSALRCAARNCTGGSTKTLSDFLSSSHTFSGCAP